MDLKFGRGGDSLGPPSVPVPALRPPLAAARQHLAAVPRARGGVELLASQAPGTGHREGGGACGVRGASGPFLRSLFWGGFIKVRIWVVSLLPKKG